MHIFLTKRFLQFALDRHDKYIRSLPHGRKANFSNCLIEDEVIRNVDFEFALLNNARLSGVRLLKCNFFYNDIHDTEFIDVNFKDIKMIGVSFTNCRFTRCKISKGHSSELHSIRFDKCVMDQVSFVEVSPEDILFRDCHLSDCEFTKSTLRGGVIFDRCGLSKCSFNSTKISGSFKCSQLCDISFRRAQLSYVEFIDNVFKGVSFRYTNLASASLRDMDLSGVTNWENSVISSTDFSGSTGLLDPIDYLKSNFEFDSEGLIVYKTFGIYKSSPPYWDIKPGAEIKEIVNSDRYTECGCGINVGTPEWVFHHAEYKIGVWKCLIPWEYLPGVVVPLNTDGKIRTSRLRLLEKMSNQEFEELRNDAYR